MSQEPYRSAARVSWIIDKCCDHRGQKCVQRLQGAGPSIIPVRAPASWLNQVESYFFIVQLKGHIQRFRLSGKTGGGSIRLPGTFKFSTTHCTKIERIALVGDKAWEKWMAKVCKPFTMAKINYFAVSEVDAAKEWLAET